ncbi:MAG: ABC transporter permease [Eubacteriales bacterium]|nr:ABC transporter permease [Eubacteriales bacterium]
MFNHIREMTKMTFRVLIRNKMFIFFGIAMMLGATFLLNISVGKTEKKEEITVMEEHDAQIAYLQDYEKFQVKIYNQNDNADALLKELASGGMFQIFEVKCKEMSREEIMASAEYTSMHDKVDAVVIIGGGEIEQSITLYQSGSDERYDFFETFLESKVRGINSSENKVAKEVVVETLENTSQAPVWDMEVDSHKTVIYGNALALYTVAFLFSGIIILGTIISEKDNLVYTRILLSKASSYSYILSKFVVIVVTAFLETVIALFGYNLFVKADVGLNTLQFGVILFGMGLIFNSLSVAIGICCGNTLTASIAGFSIWVMTALLGGLYFDINNSSVAFKRVASFMPQRWGLKAASLFMNGNNLGYPLIIIVSITYVSVVLLIGVLGLKLTSKE